jgi:hypothetical protein
MWTKKGVLWVPGREPAYKIADRPHWITIGIGVLSPLLAVVAVFISYKALGTSDKTLKVANRAYVALVGGTMVFSDFGTVVNEDKGISTGYLVVRLDLSASIQNAGNSPAEAGTFRPKYRLPPGWSEAPAWLKKRLSPNSIGVI